MVFIFSVLKAFDDQWTNSTNMIRYDSTLIDAIVEFLLTFSFLNLRLCRDKSQWNALYIHKNENLEHRKLRLLVKWDQVKLLSGLWLCPFHEQQTISWVQPGKVALKFHLALHHNKNRLGFKPGINFKFRFISCFTTAFLLKDLTEVDRFKCTHEGCGKGFQQKYQLNQHELVHSGNISSFPSFPQFAQSFQMLVRSYAVTQAAARPSSAKLL